MQRQDNNSFVITGRAAEYTIERRIAPAAAIGDDSPASPRLIVEDTFTSLLSDAPLGLAFENKISSTAPSSRPECLPSQWNKHYPDHLSPCIHVGGLRRETGVSFSNAYTAFNLAWNPSIFVSHPCIPPPSFFFEVSLLFF